MSFKREGDDKSQLNILQKRRVADLLSNFIPDDEAALLKNGRYTCLVCSYRPVFDTVDILTVHRKGKRHLEGLKSFYGRKSQLKNDITKRQHENYVQAEEKTQEASSSSSSSSSAPLLALTRKITRHALLKTAPYDSCHRKTSTKSEKGTTSTTSAFSSNACSKMSSDQENTRRKTEASERKVPNSITAENKELQPSQDTNTNTPQLLMVPEAEPMTVEKRRELEHYLKLKSDGWIQDRSGRWIKDENVEFDSDEEDEPPSLP